MKSMINFSVLFFLLVSNADAATCNTKNVSLTINSTSKPDCKKISIDGIYQLKLCDNEKGKLTSSKGDDASYLFIDNGLWVARQDLVDYTNNRTETEIFKFNEFVSKFSILKTISKFNGKVIKQFKCNGLVKESI